MALTMQTGQSVSEGVYTKPVSEKPEATPSKGGVLGTGYTSFRDMFDGGGPGRSGARFSSADTGAYDTNNDYYISEAEYAAAQASNPNFAATQGGIARLSNGIGARPLNSYQNEQALGAAGTNIGTTGIASFFTNGIAGNILGALRGHNMGQANPNMPANAPFTMENLQASGMTPEQATSYLSNAQTGMQQRQDAILQQQQALAAQQAQQQAQANPVNVLMTGGLAGLARHMYYGGMV